MVAGVTRTPDTNVKLSYTVCCSKALSQRVSVYSKKLVGEQDALAVEVGVLSETQRNVHLARPVQIGVART